MGFSISLKAMPQMRLYFLSVLFVLKASTLVAQCHETSNPNKWLYKPYLERIPIAYPASVTYATRMVDLN
ncbi:MAG: hypothetical protein WAU70_18135, partial [Flavobacteriales bacterium]